MTTRERFHMSYLETAFWSSTDDNGNPLEETFSIEDIDSDDFNETVTDCNAFIEKARELIEQAISEFGYDWSRAGHDFWLTRNGHGAGFWDRGLGEIGETLTSIAEKYGPSDLYVGDDGSLYLYSHYDFTQP